MFKMKFLEMKLVGRK